MRKRDGIRVSNGLLERRLGTDGNRVSRQPEVSQYGLRDKGTFYNSAGIEGRGAAETTEEHLPAWALIARTPARQVGPWKSVGGGKVLETLGLNIEARQTIVGPHPSSPRLSSKMQLTTLPARPSGSW